MLTTLESGIRTGDFGKKDKAPAGTKEFHPGHPSDRLGNKPATVPAVDVPEANEAIPQRLPTPTGQQVIRTFQRGHPRRRLRYLLSTRRSARSPSPKEMQRAPRQALQAHADLQPRHPGVAHRQRLHKCVDYYRVRFELKDNVPPGSFGQSRCVALMDSIAEAFTVCSYELLRTFDGIKGYSLAQDQ